MCRQISREVSVNINKKSIDAEESSKENRQNKKYLYWSNIMMAMNGTVWGIRLPWRTDLDKARGRNEEIKYEKRWFVLFKRAKLAQTGGQARFNTLLNIFQCKTRKLWQKNSLWYSHAGPTTIRDLLIKKLGTVLKILTNENMYSGQFVHQHCQLLCPVGKMWWEGG